MSSETPAMVSWPVFFISLIWGCTGFDGASDVGKAGGGFSLASLKNENLQVIADNTELVAA